MIVGINLFSMCGFFFFLKEKVTARYLYVVMNGNWQKLVSSVNSNLGKFYLNRNNTMSKQLVRDQFSVISFHLIIHTFLPESLRKTGSHPKPSKHVLRYCTTIYGFTILSAVIFGPSRWTVTTTTLYNNIKNIQGVLIIL